MFTSNRGEKTVGLFPHGQETRLEKVKVGGDPNGLAFDSSQDNLLAANVSGPDDPVPITASIVDVKNNILTADILMPEERDGLFSTRRLSVSTSTSPTHHR